MTIIPDKKFLEELAMMKKALDENPSEFITQQKKLNSKRGPIRRFSEEEMKIRNYESRKRHYIKHREKHLKLLREYYQKNKERIKEHHKKYYSIKGIENSKRYYERNKETILNHGKKIYEENKEQIKKQRKEYYDKNREKINRRNLLAYHKRKLKNKVTYPGL